MSDTPERCPNCGAIGMDNCERVTCSWDQWDDGTRVTAKQRADGFAFAEKINAYLEARAIKEGLVHFSPPCEHDFKGWREFEDGRGGEQVCTKCGMGAMEHTLRNDPT